MNSIIKSLNINIPNKNKVKKIKSVVNFELPSDFNDDEIFEILEDFKENNEKNDEFHKGKTCKTDSKFNNFSIKLNSKNKTIGFNSHIKHAVSVGGFRDQKALETMSVIEYYKVNSELIIEIFLFNEKGK